MSTVGNDYRDNFAGCRGTTYAIGDTLQADSEQGNMVGPTKQGVDVLTSTDPGATWNATSKSITGSCAPGVCADGKYYTTSPRVVAVALFDIDAFYAGAPNGKSTVTITNIMGFFVEGMGGSGNKDVIGRLVEIPGLTKGTSSVTATAAFLHKVMLVR